MWLCKYGLSCSINNFCEAFCMHSLAYSNSNNPCCTPEGQQSADAMRGQDSLQTDTPQGQIMPRCKASMQDIANRQDTSKPIETNRWAYAPKTTLCGISKNKSPPASASSHTAVHTIRHVQLTSRPKASSMTSLAGNKILC